jgi:hypothetical protein
VQIAIIYFTEKVFVACPLMQRGPNLDLLIRTVSQARWLLSGDWKH